MATPAPLNAGVGYDSPFDNDNCSVVGSDIIGENVTSNELRRSDPFKLNATAFASFMAILLLSSVPSRGGGTISASVTAGNHFRD